MSALQFEDLPRRIFLDTCVLQIIAQYGEFLWENVEPEPEARIYAIPGGFDELNALHGCLFINQRGAFEYAVADNSIIEIVEKGDHFCTAYSLEMLAYWSTISAAWPPHLSDKARAARIDGGSFAYLSVKDRRLVRDAVRLGCDAFLTIDRKLARNARHIETALGIKVLQPLELWEILAPWAAIF